MTMGTQAEKGKTLLVTIETPSLSLDPIVATRVRVKTVSGWWGFMPQHRDIVTLVLPGIVTCSQGKGRFLFVAVDEGILTKSKERLTLAVRKAASGPSTAALERIVLEEYKAADEHAAHTKQIIARLEADFLKCFPVGSRLT